MGGILSIFNKIWLELGIRFLKNQNLKK